MTTLTPAESARLSDLMHRGVGYRTALAFADTMTQADLDAALAAFSSSKFAPSGVPSYAGARFNDFDPARSVYNWKASNTRKLRASMGKAYALTGYSTHYMFGDSKTSGLQAGANNSWPRVLQRQLATAGYPIGGWISMLAQALSAGDTRVSQNNAVNSGHYIQLQSSGSSVTYVSQDAGIGASIWFSRAGSPFSITIDGAAPANGNVLVSGGTYSAGVVTPAAGSAWGQATVYGLSNAPHTVVCGWVSGISYIGTIEIGQGSGIRVLNWGISGIAASTILSAGAFGWPNSYTQPVAMGPPDVVWIVLGGNDCNTGRTPQQLYDDLTTIRNTFSGSALGWNSTPDWIIGVETEGFSTTVGNNWRTNFAPRIYDLADAWDVPLIDFENIEGTLANGIANGLISGDNIHEVSAGQAMLGSVAARAVR